MTQDAMIALEEKVAHLTRMVEDLSDVVAEQAQSLQVAERRVAMLMQRAAATEAENSNTIPLADQRPPHW